MNNRRNYYRILKVQPDASTDVIKTNYRTLLQKLRMHPDLGGDERNASLINMAYNTLRNPVKRAEYDNVLLEEYCIKQLSRGHIKQTSEKKNKSVTTPSSNNNQRNYYRVLHVQTDSPEAIISSSYQTLSKKTNSPKASKILKEAFQVLTNPKQKKFYDQALLKCDHAEAVNLLKQQTTTTPKTSSKQNALTASYQSNNISNTDNTKTTASAYKPLITQYCSFCKTPHNQSPSPQEAPHCMECDSPLFAPPETLLNQARRGINRLQSINTVDIYYDWPGKTHRFRMLDISPTGIRIDSKQLIESGQILKIEAGDFKAVGEVTHSQKEDSNFHTGIRFLTVQFQKQKGQFFSARA